jgi:hypothetical protein
MRHGVMVSTAASYSKVPDSNFVLDPLAQLNLAAGPIRSFKQILE